MSGTAVSTRRGLLTVATQDVDLLSELHRLEPAPNGSRRNQGAYGNTYWAAKTDSTSGGINSASTPSSSGGGGACGAMGLDFLLMLGLLQLGLRRMRRA